VSSPIKNQIGPVFIPVSNIENARDWYCTILGLPNDGDILSGHLYIIPMQGTTGIILDSKIYSADKVFKTPMFHFNTDDIKESYEFMRSKKVEIITEVEHGHWFNFKDMDGNLMMVCKC
jgi:catechol 2,3-dioxygenase-like lactoylglutathione lyase family enzyme